MTRIKNIPNMYTMKANTQENIAEKAGISQGYLSKTFAGLTNPTVSIVIKIARAMGVRPSTILNKIIAAQQNNFTDPGGAA